MGCPAFVLIGDNLTFSVCTHDPDTGVLTDAASVPSYRVYEDETGTAILTGNMAKLDDTNTTGFYTEQIACTSANGFEDRKSYTIYIEATVDSDKGGISFSFMAFAATRGTAGTALPNAAADAAGGLPISDAGGLDLDAKLANTNEVTAARMGALTDWIDGGRLDLILDSILDDTDLIDDATSGLAKIATDAAAILTDTGTTLDGKIDTIDGIVDTIVARVVGTIAAGTHSPQSGDAYARLGSPAGASIAADIADVPTAAELTAGLAALNDITVAEVWAQIIDGTVTALVAMKHQLAAANGNMVKGESNDYKVKDRAGNTLYTITFSETERTRS